MRQEAAFSVSAVGDRFFCLRGRRLLFCLLNWRCCIGPETESLSKRCCSCVGNVSCLGGSPNLFCLSLLGFWLLAFWLGRSCSRLCLCDSRRLFNTKPNRSRARSKGFCGRSPYGANVGECLLFKGSRGIARSDHSGRLRFSQRPSGEMGTASPTQCGPSLRVFAATVQNWVSDDRNRRNDYAAETAPRSF